MKYSGDSNRVKSLHDKIWQNANEKTHYFIHALFFLGLALSPLHASYDLAIVMGSLSLGSYWLMRSFSKNQLIFHLSVSLILWNFVAQFILQAQGMKEMYFFYFVGLAILTTYKDWRTLLPFIFYALFTCLFFFYLGPDSGKLGGRLQGMTPPTGEVMIAHFGIFILFGILCVLWTISEKKEIMKYIMEKADAEHQLMLMETNISFADSISQGNLEAEYQADKADRLGESLMNMRDNLLSASERESKEKFISVGLTSIDSILRNNTDDLGVLCDKVIAQFVKYMRANQGAIFIVQKEEEEEEYLQLMACWAYERKKYISKQVGMGEGIVGQVAMEKSAIRMTNVPKSYVNITSGLGSAAPNSLIVVPLKSREEVVGVIELASFKNFEEADVEFAEKMAESIAATIISVKTNQQTKELLEESRQMTEEMKAQEEEIRQNMEEMSSSQENMRRSQEELERVKKNLEVSIQRFELASATTTEGLWDLKLPDDLRINENTFFWWSDKMRQMLGYENEIDFPNKLSSWVTLLHPEDKDNILAGFNNHLMDFSGKTPYDMTYQLKRKSGEYHWYRGVGKTHRSDTGKPMRVAGTLIDIQDKVDLNKLKKLHERITEGMGGIQFQYRLSSLSSKMGEQGFSYVSDKSEVLLGFSPEQMTEDTFRLESHEGDECLFNKDTADFDKPKTFLSEEFRIKTKAGDFNWFLMECVAETEEDGTVICSGLLQNIDKFKNSSSQG